MAFSGRGPFAIQNESNDSDWEFSKTNSSREGEKQQQDRIEMKRVPNKRRKRKGDVDTGEEIFLKISKYHYIVYKLVR